MVSKVIMILICEFWMGQKFIMCLITPQNQLQKNYTEIKIYIYKQYSINNSQYSKKNQQKKFLDTNTISQITYAVQKFLKQVHYKLCTIM